MAQRKLGRGLGALVTLSPAEADGTARIDEAVSGASDASVLSLSGRSVEDFFRVVTVEDIVAVRAPQAAAPAADEPVADVAGDADADDAEPAPMEAPDEDAREVQYTLFDPVIDDGPAVVSERPASEQPTMEMGAPEPTAETPAPVSSSPPADADRPAPPETVEPGPPSAADPADIETTDVEPATTDAVLAPGPVAEPATVPETVLDDEMVFIDDAVGGFVLPDVEME